MTALKLDIPRVETDRLILREWKPEDLDPYCEFTADPEMVRYLNGQTTDRNGTWRQIAMMTGHFALRGYGFWAVEEKATGAFVGRAGVWFPEGWPAPEIGWSFLKNHHGRGFATEAGLASAHWAFDNLDLDSLISVIVPGNEASIAVATKIGERFDRMEEVAGVECCIYKVKKGELAG